ncbi:DUF2851 family protein [Ferruginibacter sp.]
MTERLLQYIWQFQYFNKTNLHTVEEETVQVIHAGTYNTNQGPDFMDAKIKIGNTVWAGSVELHINSSDWKNHKHSGDNNYKNVILHVVWQHDVSLQLPFSTLTLQDKVSKFLLSRYSSLLQSGQFIACEKTIHQVNALTFTAWKERLLVERLQARCNIVFEYLQQNNNHWEESFWWMIAKNFGVKVNSTAFEKLAQSLSINILAKHKNQIHQLEALLFGQASLLENEFSEAYPQLLQREYRFLKKKYRLQKVEAPFFFLRMRPANFPSLRLAQLAMLVHNSSHLFAAIKESKTVQEVRILLNVTANDYWHYHYVFDEPGAFKKKKLGAQMIDNILINTVSPVIFAYGVFHSDNSYKDKALQWLMEINAEQNAITRAFTSLKVGNKNAFDSQALLQLKHAYCDKKKCLDCAVGNQLLKNSPQISRSSQK